MAHAMACPGLSWPSLVALRSLLQHATASAKPADATSWRARETNRAPRAPDYCERTVLPIAESLLGTLAIWAVLPMSMEKRRTTRTTRNTWTSRLLLVLSDPHDPVKVALYSTSTTFLNTRGGVSRLSLPHGILDKGWKRGSNDCVRRWRIPRVDATRQAVPHP